MLRYNNSKQIFFSSGAGRLVFRLLVVVYHPVSCLPVIGRWLDVLVFWGASTIVHPPWIGCLAGGTSRRIAGPDEGIMPLSDWYITGCIIWCVTAGLVTMGFSMIVVSGSGSVISVIVTVGVVWTSALLVGFGVVLGVLLEARMDFLLSCWCSSGDLSGDLALRVTPEKFKTPPQIPSNFDKKENL